MPDEIKKPLQNQANPNFVTKPVETPILDSGLREKIGQDNAENNQQGGFKGFYQANKIYFWAILAGSLIIAALAFFAFRKSPAMAPKEANIGINVQVPSTVPSGGQALYTITLQNNDSQKLVNLELELAYPDGMTYVDSGPSSFKPSNLSGTLFPVPDLLPEQNTPLFLKTKVAGNVNDQKTLNIKLHYKYNNFNSEFVKAQSSIIRLVASDVVIELNGPTNTNNAQVVVYSVKYQNNSGNDIKNARVKMNYADGFNFGSSAPPPDLGSDTWNIGTLAKGGSGTIEIQGTFNASVNSGESKTAMAELLILGQGGQFFTQNSSSFTTAISSLPLLVAQDLQSSNFVNVIDPGDNLNFSIRYQNNGNTVATGVNILVNLDSKVIDLKTLRAEGGQVNNNSILWNASSVPQLESLAPNESGQMSFSLQIYNPATKDASKNLTLVSNIKIKSNEYDSYFPGAPLTLKVSSPSIINKSLSYVSGQLPPQAGNTTTYKVRLALTNSSNDFSNGLLTAFIPLGAGGFVTGSVTPSEANNTQFDSSTGKLTWNAGPLPANTGRFSQPKVLEFQVKLAPASSQVGQSPVLVKIINFSAKDLFTGQDVNLTSEDIKTSDISGSNGYGNGQVVQ